MKPHTEALPRPQPPATNRWLLWATVAVSLLVLGPVPMLGVKFQAGHIWFCGLLLGGFCAWLAGQACLHVAHSSSDGSMDMARATIAACAPALPAVAVPLLWLKDASIDALTGVVSGWLIITSILIVDVLRRAEPSGLREEAGPSGPSAAESPSHGLFQRYKFNRSNSDSPPRIVTQNIDSQQLPDLTDAAPPNMRLNRAACCLAASAGFVAILGSTAALGIYRELLATSQARGTLSALAVAVGSTMLVSFGLGAAVQRWRARRCEQATRLFSGSAPDENNALGSSSPQWPEVLVALGTAGAVGTLYTLGLMDAPRQQQALVTVLGLGMFAGWLTPRVVDEASSFASDGAARSAHPSVAIMAPLAVLLVLSSTMVAHFLLQGFGVGLMALGLWLPLSMALSQMSGREQENDSPAVPPARTTPAEVTIPIRTQIFNGPALIHLLLFAVILVLFRFFSWRFRDDLQSTTLSDHYALFGFLVGALLPPLLTRSLSRHDAAPASTQLVAGSPAVHLLLAWAMALTVPAVILLLWGARCAPPLIVGLALSCVLTSGVTHSSGAATLVAPLLAVGAVMALSQWTEQLVALADLPRADRIKLLAAFGGVLLLLMLARDWRGRKKDEASTAASGAGGT
jgi:hypothetical protein